MIAANLRRPVALVFVNHPPIALRFTQTITVGPHSMNMPTVLNRPPAPAELNELDVLDDGSVALKQECANVAFGFRACGLPFSAETRLTETGPVLQIAADIGGDPYSAGGAIGR